MVIFLFINITQTHCFSSTLRWPVPRGYSRDSWRSASPTPLPKQGHLEPAAYVQLTFEYPKDTQRWRMESPQPLRGTCASTQLLSQEKSKKVHVWSPSLLVTIISSVNTWENRTNSPYVQTALGAHGSTSVVTTHTFGKNSLSWPFGSHWEASIAPLEADLLTSVFLLHVEIFLNTKPLSEYQRVSENTIL